MSFRNIILLNYLFTFMLHSIYDSTCKCKIMSDILEISNFMVFYKCCPPAIRHGWQSITMYVFLTIFFSCSIHRVGVVIEKRQNVLLKGQTWRLLPRWVLCLECMFIISCHENLDSHASHFLCLHLLCYASHISLPKLR